MEFQANTTQISEPNPASAGVATLESVVLGSGKRPRVEAQSLARDAGPMVYHILSETEAFSEHYGGALSRWTANVLREDRHSKIVCPWADETWGFPAERVWALPELKQYVTWAKRLAYRPLFNLRVYLLRKIFRPMCEQFKPGDTVYVANRPDSAVAIEGLCRGRNIRVVLHMHNSHLLSVPRRRLRTLRLNAVVFCSEFLRSEAREHLPSSVRTLVIPSGADESCFYPKVESAREESQVPVVLFVGRLVPDKGVHIFQDALRQLAQKGVPARGRIIGCVEFGRDVESDYLRTLKERKPENVEFGEYVTGEALGDEFRQASIFCCPSVWNEPFGMVNVEAMACGLPVVASAVGGIPEIFRHGGAMLVPGGSVSALADALEILITDPARRKEIAAEGTRSFEGHFRWTAVREQYLKLVETLQERI